MATPAGDLNEGDYVHLETRIEPRNDAYVVVEWYHNNRLIQTGQRLRPHQDFGIVTLDIVGAYGEDTGTFTVKATNSLGSDSVSVNLKVAGAYSCSFIRPHKMYRAKSLNTRRKHFFPKTKKNRAVSFSCSFSAFVTSLRRPAPKLHSKLFYFGEWRFLCNIWEKHSGSIA